MGLADRAELAVRLTLDDRAFTGGLRRSQGALGKFGASAGRVGKGVGQLGLGLARIGVTAAIATAGGLALVARKSIEWESALAGVNKTMDLTPDELSAIGTEIRVLATQIPIGADAIAGLAEQAGALGIAKDDVVEFARVAATLGVTTNVSADQAATSLGVMSNLLKLTGTDYERFASTLVDLGNKGASTESAILAIAERAAGAGATIGLTAESILAFSSAVANIGIEPEAGGSSLQKFFLETLKAVNQGGSDLKTFAKTAGTSADEFAKVFKDDPGVALESFIQGLSELSKGKRLDVLEDLGFSDIRITRMLLGLAEAEKNNDNLSDSLEISASAWAANTAAAEEADKRYKTVGSKLELLKNQAIEGALLIGEGFLPALGRMADKLKGILADPEQRKIFTDFGKDIGTIIDGIDFKKVLGGAQTFLGVIKTLWSILRLIPIELTAAAVALGGLNTLSGGLLGAGAGNILGGITESVGRSLFTKIPGIGKFGALPVYVVNMGVGGFGGPGGGAPGFFGRAAGGLGAALGGGAALGALGIAVSGAILGGLLTAVQKLVIEPRLQQEAGENISDVERVIATGDPAQIRSALDGIRASVANLGGLDKILYDLNANGVKLHTESLIAALKAALQEEPRKNLQPLPKDISPKEQAAFDRLRDKVESNRIATVTVSQKEQAKLDALKVGQAAFKAAQTLRLDALKAGQAASKVAQIAAAHTDTARMIAAIQAARPIVSVVVNAATNYSTVVKTGTTLTKAGGGGPAQNKLVPVW